MQGSGLVHPSNPWIYPGGCGVPEALSDAFPAASSSLALPRLLCAKVVNTTRINNNTPVIVPTIVPIKASLPRLLLPPDAGVVVKLEIPNVVTVDVVCGMVVVVELGDGTEEGPWMENESPVSCCPVSVP
jgi:hypothetical protein